MKSVLGIDRAELVKPPPNTSALGISSDGLGWNGFSILEYFGDRGERPEQSQERYVIGLWRRNVATGEWPNERGRYVPYTRYPGRTTFIPPSIIRRHVAHNRYDVVLCLLDPAFVDGVEKELDHRPTEQLSFQANLNDPPLRHLITLLAAEAVQGGTLGRLYADHLAHAIAVRLLLIGAVGKRKAYAAASGLPPYLMRRVVERMHDFDSNLDLETLAAETGYSRSHFLRLFHASTGVPPHRYLLHLRLERAKELIRLPHRSLIEVAVACGFSSHGHMSRVFRQLLGVTPAEYRRKL